MRYVFSVYCVSGTQAMKLYYKLSKIQIKSILMMSTDRNETEKDTKRYPYVINILTDVKKVDYMLSAIKEKIYDDTILEYHEAIGPEQQLD